MKSEEPAGQSAEAPIDEGPDLYKASYQPPREEKRPGTERWGSRPKRKELSPAEFAQAVLDEHRRSLVSGYMGIRCSRAGLLASLRIVAEASGTPCQRPGLPLPRALRSLSAQAQQAIDRASFSGYESLQKSNLDRAALAGAERLALLLAALRIYRNRAGIMHRDFNPEKIVSPGDPVEQELCQELSSQLATWPALIKATERERLATPSQTSLTGGSEHAQTQGKQEQKNDRQGSRGRAEGSGSRRKRSPRRAPDGDGASR